MHKILKVHLATPSPDLVHQFRNFGEDVYGAFGNECEISIHEIDASTSEFYVRGIHKRELLTIMAKIRKIAEKNLMSEIINICEVIDEQNT